MSEQHNREKSSVPLYMQPVPPEPIEAWPEPETPKEVESPPIWKSALTIHEEIRQRVEKYFNKEQGNTRYRVYQIDQHVASKYGAGGGLHHVEWTLKLATMVFYVLLEDSIGMYAAPAISCQVEVQYTGECSIKDVNWRPGGEAIKLP